MKRISILGLVVGILFFFSCEEVGPSINTSGGGGTGGTQAQQRKVLIEDFTGVRCKNCPLAGDLLEQLSEIHGDRLVVVGIHTGYFAQPYPESQYDFRTETSSQINTYLGTATSNPLGAVNRTIFDGQSDYIIDKQFWTEYTSNELAKAPKVGVNIDKNFNSSSRKLDVTVNLSFLEDITDPLTVSVLITESKLKDIQLMPDNTKNAEYVHKHVLRGAMSNSTGSPYTGGATTANAMGSQSFSMTIPNDWNVTNCSVVAFVSNATTKSVLQVEEKHIAN